MKTPEHTTAEVFPRYLGGEVLADSATLKWPGLFARRYRFPRVVDGFLVPATAEPLITCHLNGSAEFQERDIGGVWVPRKVRRGDIFVTGSKSPYELRWRSPLGAEIDVIHIHLAVDQCLAAFQMVYQDKAGAVEVADFFGHLPDAEPIRRTTTQLIRVKTRNLQYFPTNDLTLCCPLTWIVPSANPRAR
jgi:AraC family transcriptional regulator